MKRMNHIILISIIFLLSIIPFFSKIYLYLQILPSDNLYNYSLRIVRDVSFELMPGKFHTPEELRERGYILNEITLEGIVEPEAIPEDEEFIIYEVNKDSKVIGWLWQERFLDEEKLQKRYELFIEAHARIDNILGEVSLRDWRIGKDNIRKLDTARNRLHKWAILFKFTKYELFHEGIEKSAILNEVKNEIVRKQKAIGDMDASLTKLAEEGILKFPNMKYIYHPHYLERNYYRAYEMYQYRSAIWKQRIQDVVKLSTFIMTEDDSYTPTIKKWNVSGKIISALDIFYNKILGIKFPFVQYSHRVENLGQIMHGYKVMKFKIEHQLIFNVSFLPLIKKQINYLAQKAHEMGYNYEVKMKTKGELKAIELAQLLNQVDWSSYYPQELREYFRNPQINSLGLKAGKLLRLQKLSIPVPNFLVLNYKDYKKINELTIEKFKDPLKDFLGYPKLYSIRSSPPYSMPGFLKTLLNIGYSREDWNSWLGREKFKKFSFKTYLKFLKGFAIDVYGLSSDIFPIIPQDAKVSHYEELTNLYENIILENGFEIPTDISSIDQIRRGVKTVSDSWNSERAKQYREAHNISFPDNYVLPVIIQEMKFGNLNRNSGSFVLFTRDPITGEKGLYIEYAPQSQGDALVGGEIDPVPLEESGLSQKIIDEIRKYAGRIEKEFGYAQDIEGVIEDGGVWILQTRDAKLSSGAEIKALVDMVEEGILTKEEALMRINLEDLEDRLSHMQVDPTVSVSPITTGLGASSGAVQGVIALSKEKAKEFKKEGLPVILIKDEVFPTDLETMYLVDGLLTKIGGILSHGAVLGRSINLPTVVGCGNLEIDRVNENVTIGEKTYKEGDYITLDGTGGVVYDGQIPLVEPEEINPYLEILKEWYKEIYGEDIE